MALKGKRNSTAVVPTGGRSTKPTGAACLQLHAHVAPVAQLGHNARAWPLQHMAFQRPSIAATCGRRSSPAPSAPRRVVRLFPLQHGHRLVFAPLYFPSSDPLTRLAEPTNQEADARSADAARHPACTLSTPTEPDLGRLNGGDPLRPSSTMVAFGRPGKQAISFKPLIKGNLLPPRLRV